MMDYATNFAIVENGRVTRVVWGMTYTPIPNAVQVDDRAVQKGDEYRDGKFYRDGEEVKTISELMADMKAALEVLGVSE